MSPENDIQRKGRNLAELKHEVIFDIVLLSCNLSTFKAEKNSRTIQRGHIFPSRKEIPWSFGNLLYHLIKWTEVEIMGEFMPLLELSSYSHLFPFIKKITHTRIQEDSRGGCITGPRFSSSPSNHTINTFPLLLMVLCMFTWFI